MVLSGLEGVRCILKGYLNLEHFFHYFLFEQKRQQPTYEAGLSMNDKSMYLQTGPSIMWFIYTRYHGCAHVYLVSLQPNSAYVVFRAYIFHTCTVMEACILSASQISAKQCTRPKHAQKNHIIDGPDCTFFFCQQDKKTL